MTASWPQLSKPLTELPGTHFDVVVVGSGYGGGVAASRLARFGVSIAVLERGREMWPGEYPTNMAQAGDEWQTTMSGATIGRKDGLFDLRIFDDVNVLVGCGLGGTSLINANAAVEPDPRVYANWPALEGEDWPSALAPYFDKARAMLGSAPYPDHKTPEKLKALEKVADKLGAELQRPDINVTFREGHTAGGLWQSACTDCGNCVTGCNFGAKNTVLMNYLPDAHASDAKIFNGAELRRVTRVEGKTPQDPPIWALEVLDNNSAGGEPYKITADVVILAAGTLGSTEILLRSSDKLSLSKTLGHSFSGNGDTWSLGFNANMADDDGSRAPVYGIGAAESRPASIPNDPAHRPGPTITGMVHVRNDDLSKTVMIEEGALPGAFAAGYAVGLPGLATIESDPFRFGDLAQRVGDMVQLAGDIATNSSALADTAYDGPVSRTLPFLTFSHDKAAGVMTLKQDRISITWGDAGQDPALLYTDEVLRDACDAIQAEYMPFLTSTEAFGSRMMVVHPLGGCAMGVDATEGVVNTDCQVFDDAGDVHPGLYVMDGSVIPSSLGANPHLAITAIAERAVERLARDREWTIKTASPQILKSQTEEAKSADHLAALNSVIEGFTALKAAVDGKAYELAEMLLKGFWRQVLDAAKDLKDETGKPIKLPNLKKFMKHFGTDKALEEVTGPLTGQFLDVLVPINDALETGDMTALMAALDDKIGDISPAATFPEEMTGHITPIGLNDPEQDFETHTLLGDGAWECKLKATLTCDAIRAMVKEPVGSAKITDGTFTCEEFGGVFSFHEDSRFQFLAPDDTAVDRWRVTYDGTLKAKNGTSYTFKGRKTLQHRKGSHWWRDLCDLNVDIYETGRGDSPPKVATGRMVVSLENAIRQANGFSVRYDDLEGALERAWNEIKTALKDQSRNSNKTFPNCSKPNIRKLLKLFARSEFRVLCVKAALSILDEKSAQTDAPLPSETMAAAFKTQFLARAAGLVFRTYGGIYSYGVNFANLDLEAHPPAPPKLPDPEIYYPQPDPGILVKLTRYRAPRFGAHKGPVILANGFGVKASAFAVPTTEHNLVEMLVDDGFDVWLFDYRGSGDAPGSTSPFTIDDVAKKDWPTAIDMVLDRTGAKDVQVLVHCVGALSLFMAVLAGETRIRSIIASQLGAHSVTNWFKALQFDTEMGESVARGLPKAIWPALDLMGVEGDLADMAKTGVPVLDVRSPNSTYSQEANAAIDGLLWAVPPFSDVPCKSPTCHRINFVFGPTYRHENLNQATHAYIPEMFGAVSSTPFLHLALMFDSGRLTSARINSDGTVSATDETKYYEGHANFSMPVHFIAGAQNPEILPEASLRSWDWLRRVNETPQLFTRHVYQGYGHMDCFVGRTAWEDIFPDLIEILNDPQAAQKHD